GPTPGHPPSRPPPPPPTRGGGGAAAGPGGACPAALQNADTLAHGDVGGSSSRESADGPSCISTSDNTQPPAPRSHRPWKLPLGVTPASPGARVALARTFCS